MGGGVGERAYVYKTRVCIVINRYAWYTGYGITWKNALVMIWAGLRGAVGLVLALFTLFDPSVGTYEFRVWDE